MSTSPTALSSEKPSTLAVEQTRNARHLYGPVLDFLLLGGGSILPLALVYWLWPTETDTAALATSTLVLANLINHPHFAHSYQLFYRNFRARVTGKEFCAALRWRYIFAALVAPTLLIAFFSYCLLTGAPSLLGKGANLMLFLVGWHYVKQGFGMLMLDAALKKNYFDATSKKILLANAHAVWLLSYLLANDAFQEKELWNLKYYSFQPPGWLITGMACLVVLTSIGVLVVMGLKLRENRKTGSTFPFSGAVAYAVSAYLWLLVRHPAALLIIPALHSLQYLAVVWRYQVNFEAATVNPARTPRIWNGTAGFLLFGLILGYLGFWAIPSWLTTIFNPGDTPFGSGLFLFIFWVFINIHHYFIDNVLWRKENPDTRHYLFGTG